LKIIILLLFICFNIYQINAIEKEKYINTEGVFSKNSSSVFLFKTDSLIKIKYNRISKLKDEEKYVIALKEALELVDECKKNEDSFWIYKASYLLGDIYKSTNKLEKSLKFYKESLALLNSTSSEKEHTKFTTLDFAKTVLRVGTIYHRLAVSIDITKNRSILDSIKESQKKKIFTDSAKLFYEKTEQFATLNIEIENLKATAFSNLSTIYEVDSNYVKATYYVQKAIEINKNNNNNLRTANALNNLGNIYLSQKEYQKSKRIYTEGLELIKNNNNPKAIKSKAILYFNLAWAMRNLKEFKAYDYQELYYEIQEDRREKEFRGIIDEVTEKYDFDSKKELLLKEEENKRLKDQQTFWIIGIIALITIISLIYVINLYKLKQKNLALSFSQNQLLKNQEIEKLKSESQVRILNATIDGKETERKQIAETLHDSVSALLSSANLHLQATRKQFNGRTPIEIDKTQKIIEEASYKVRDLSHNLVSSVLLKFGLTFAINDIADKYSNSELTIDTEITNIGRYLQSFEIKVYNIIQEFINNILKHSEADNALIELKEENNIIFLTISDDGIGFDKTKINTKAGLGINQIDARIQMMRGKFNIKSSENNGTKISVELPIVEKEAPNHV
jgi:two-component system, NarL family, sensor kinase